MSAVAQRVRMTREEFLAWDETQERRFEYDGYGPVAMVGGTAAHSSIKMNLYRELSTRLRGTRCRPFDNDMRIDASGSIRCPDAMVTCTPVADESTWGLDPVVVFDVTFASTAGIDLVVKNSEYRATSSIQRYVVIDQNHVWAMSVAREGARWVDQLFGSLGTVIELPEIGISLCLSDLYDGVEFGSPLLPLPE